MDETVSSLLIWIVLLPLLGASVNGFWGRHLGKRMVSVVACGVIALAFVLALIAGIPIFHHHGALQVVQTAYTWIAVPGFVVDAKFVLDALSLIMVLVITGVGLLIHVYSVGYMREDTSYNRYFAYLNLFVACMLILVLGANLPLMFVGWEGVGLCSYLLIGFWFEDESKAAAGKKAFVVNRVGDLGFLLGMFVLFGAAGTLAVDGLKLSVASGVITPAIATAAALLLFVGACGKSAQIPLYVWLPDAMAGPTPVSALIHAATMVTAGVYMIARLAFLYSIAPTASAVVVIVGSATAFLAATVGICQNDIKKVLAYSTISQLGYMFVGVGVGAYFAGVFHLMTHAFFKACLFLGSGAVIHALSGEQDITKMGALRKKLPITYYTFLISTLAISGIPPLAGFFSKDEILWQALSSRSKAPWAAGWVHQAAYLCCLASAVITAFYMARLLFLTFHGKSRLDPKVHVHHETRIMSIPLIILAFFATFGGLVGASIFHIHTFEHFLAPVFKTTEQAMDAVTLLAGLPLAEPLAAVVSIVAALLGIGLAYLFYIKNPQLPALIAGNIRGLYKMVVNKYWVDEIYDAIIVRPLHRLAVFAWKIIDQACIDSFFVRGSARLFISFGNLGKRMQTGDVQFYAFWFFTGVFCTFIYWLCGMHGIYR